MTARLKSLILAVSLAFAPALLFAQDRAVPRGGGGGGSSGGGGGHPSPGVTSSSGGSSSGYSGGSSSGSTYTPSTAERRHPRAGTGTGGHGGYGGYGGYYPYYPYYPYYGWGGYYPGWGYSYWWPYGAFGWYGGYWGYPGGGYGGGTVYNYVEHDNGSVRVLVDPSEARVYVDGYYAGTVDDFDGLFQRLHVSPGRHEIVLKLEGYKTHRVTIAVPPEGTVKIEYDMEKGQGESVEDLAKNAPENEPPRAREQEQRWTEPEQRPQMQAGETATASGRLELTVRPDDASIYVDGAFRGSAREASSVKLPAGQHRIEIVRPGYKTHEQQVDIAPGETTDIKVELERPVV